MDILSARKQRRMAREMAERRRVLNRVADEKLQVAGDEFKVGSDEFKVGSDEVAGGDIVAESVTSGNTYLHNMSLKRKIDYLPRKMRNKVQNWKSLETGS